MPHAVFSLGSQVTDVVLAERNLVPGVEPGGSRAGEPTKPALLIRDCWVVPNRLAMIAGTTADINTLVSLKLSQEVGLDPGLNLPIAFFNRERLQSSAVGEYAAAWMMKEVFHAQGTVWAPRRVGLRVEHAGGAPTVFDVDVHLDYERVDVPWMDWFIMWDFLDNAVDNELEY